MSLLRNINVDRIGGGYPRVGTFGQLVTGFKIKDIAVKWPYNVYETNYDMLPAVTTGDGSVTVSDGLLICSSAVTGTARARSKKILRYRPGNGGYSDFTVRFTGTGIAESGLENEQGDGFFVRYDNGDLILGFKRSGAGDVQTVSRNAGEWNGDANGIAIDPTKLNIIEIEYGYLGTAPINFYILFGNKRYLLHSFAVAGTLTGTHIRFPSLRMYLYAENGGTAYAGSWNAGVFGNRIESSIEDPSARSFFDGNNALVDASSAEVPFVQYISKDTYNGFTNKIETQFLFVQFATNTEGITEFNFYKNPSSVTGGTPTDINALSSIIQKNEGIVSFTGGTRIFSVKLTVGTAGRNAVSQSIDPEKFNVDLSPGDSLVITKASIGNVTGDDDTAWDFSWQELF